MFFKEIRQIIYGHTIHACGAFVGPDLEVCFPYILSAAAALLITFSIILYYFRFPVLPNTRLADSQSVNSAAAASW